MWSVDYVQVPEDEYTCFESNPASPMNIKKKAQNKFHMTISDDCSFSDSEKQDKKTKNDKDSIGHAVGLLKQKRKQFSILE